MTKTKTISTWRFEVDRGPDWLFVRPYPLDDVDEAGVFDADAELADRLWRLYESHFAHRLVLEMDAVPVLCSQTIGQLILLQRRIAAQGGLMRLCGLSETCEDALRLCRLEDSFQNYSSRACAVHGNSPHTPHLPHRPR